MHYNFMPFERKMQGENLSETLIDTFKSYYERLVARENAFISESEILPVDSLPKLSEIAAKFPVDKRNHLKTALIKLNGGLGTTMGMEKAKSLIEAKNGVTFLEIIVKQVELSPHDLYLMESFATFRDSLKMLENINAHRKVGQFIQNKFPKILKNDFSPALYPSDKALEWAPPGHGDIYTALVTSGLMKDLLDNNVKYLFISNADNLGAVYEGAIPAYMSENGVDFLMEVCVRAEEDKKGGHLAFKDGTLILRELAQCPAEELSEFQNIGKHSFFNTNNIWINLEALAELLATNNNILRLPLIFNEKNLNPRDSSSPRVFQIETAMGSAISLFKRSQALVVPRTRFRPIKTTNDLLLLRSDIYTLSSDFSVRKNTSHTPLIELDPLYYKHTDQLESRFPDGIPSLQNCRTLKVSGDFIFPATVRIRGDVFISSKSSDQIRLPENITLSGSIEF